MGLINILKWRYATKRMTGEKIPAEKLDNILEAIRLAPSSLGVQPFKIIVVNDFETRKKIRETACNQPQVVESSQLLVFAARESITQNEIDGYINHIAITRDVPVESLSGFKDMVNGLKSYSSEDFINWASRQAYISLGIALVAAAENGVDATPMEGFDPQSMDKVLNLKELGLRSVVLMAVGYRNEKEDFLVNLKKVRKPYNELFINI